MDVVACMRHRGIVPYQLRLKARSRNLRRDSTPAERKLWFEFLRDLPVKSLGKSLWALHRGFLLRQPLTGW